MDRIRIICLKCGHLVEVFENEVDDYEKCFLCQGRMVLDVDRKDLLQENERINTLQDNLITEQMSRDIEYCGHSAVWNTIESEKVVWRRLKYRKFFKAIGGKVPERDLVEEKDGKLYITEKENVE